MALVSIDAEPVDAVVNFEVHLRLEVPNGHESPGRERLASQLLLLSNLEADGTYHGHKS